MNLDIIPNGAIKRVHVSQNDVGRTLTFELFNNSTSYTVPSGATVKIQGTKPSGFGFSETCTVSGNTATIDTTEAMTDESGNIQTELSISYDDVVIGTSNFVLAVEKNPHPDTTTDGSMETIIPELTLLVNEVKGYAEEIEGTYHVYGSPWVASTVAQMTDTDKIYVYVGSESGYTNGNWYYYNGTAWVSGGVYNSVAVQTDTTLSISGMPAEAKVTGDKINILNMLTEDMQSNVVFRQHEVVGTINNASINYKWETFDCITESGKTYYIDYESKTPSASFFFVQLVDDNDTACSIVTDTRTGVPKAVQATGNGTKLRFIIYPNGSSGTLGDSCTITNVYLYEGVPYATNSLLIEPSQINYRVFEVGTGYTYTTLKSAIEEATKHMDSKVIVHGGTYNLFNEFGGSTFFNAYTNTSAVGLVLKNRVHVIFKQNAKVVFNYDGSNATVVSRFSPFNAGEYGFTLENAVVECDNCRYAVHDERGDSSDEYENKYINCKLSCLHTLDSTFLYAHFSIGSGLGHAGNVLIDNCIFETGVLFHNNYSTTDTTAKSNVVIKNSYFKHGSPTLEHCGGSTETTDIIVTNNSLASDIVIRNNATYYVNDNIAVYSWNNEVRS